MAMETPRERAVLATLSIPARISPWSQCCGRPINALVASRMSRMLSISISLVRKSSSRGHGMFATSPPETTTSRTVGWLRRYSIIASILSTGLSWNLSLSMTGVELPTRSIRVQCPQYCGHCTRMDLVGNSTPVIDKLKFQLKPVDRIDAMMEYLRSHPTVRDVVVSGGDVANMPWPRLEDFLTRLLEIDNIRDIRLATKALMGLPQHWLQGEIRAGMERVARTARSRGVSIAIHTHVNHANSVTPLVAKAAGAMLDTGIRDVRNQGVLLNGVNADPHVLLDLCFALLDGARIMPYYFYMCDMIPFSEHWRVSVADAQRLQHHTMGYLPGFATPRIVCDVPFVGKRWVHQLAEYDHERGISRWTKNYLS